MEVTVLDDLDGLAAVDWRGGEDGRQPLASTTFLRLLEATDCLAPQGWRPLHLLIGSRSAPRALMPLYLRSDSTGEFVYDRAWAAAWERAGGRYFPKLTAAVPFAPVTGPRLRVHAQAHESEAMELRAALIEAAEVLARRTRVSSVHCLFPERSCRQAFLGAGWVQRAGVQFHWFNRGYRDFEDFLDALTAKRRKEVRRERRAVQAAGIEIEVLDGHTMTPERWATLHELYCSTFERKWGEPRLTLAFFRALGNALPTQTLVFMARRAGRDVAAAFALRDGERLYGRHWGCSEYHPQLHFELCYYRTIEYCIAAKLAELDAGAQGEHKLARGFEPMLTWSAHWFADAGFADAVREHVQSERERIDAYIAELHAHSPFREPRTALGDDGR